MSYLLDTNILSELVRQKPNKNVLDWFKNVADDRLYISVLTLGEIRKGVEGITDTKRREKVRLFLEKELLDWFGTRILAIDKYVADRWGRIQSEMNKQPLPAIDSLIAATALCYDLRLVTRNTKDFSYYPLEIINPWEII